MLLLMKQHQEHKQYKYDSYINYNDKQDYFVQSAKMRQQPLLIQKKLYSSSNLFNTQVNTRYQDNNMIKMKHDPLMDSNSKYNLHSTNHRGLEVGSNNGANKLIFNNHSKAKYDTLKPRSGISSSGWCRNKMNYFKVSREELARRDNTYKERLLERELSSFLMEYDMRSKEIGILKSKAKIAKISKMETSLHKKTDEYIQLQKAIDELEDDLAENEQNLIIYQSRLEFHKDIANQAVEQLKICTSLANESQNRRETLEKDTAKLERRMRIKDVQKKQLQKQLKDLNDKIAKVKKKYEELEALKYEKESYDMKHNDNIITIKSITEQNEELKREIEKAEKIQIDYIEKLNKHEKERPKLLEKVKEPPLAYREKDKKIHELLEEINKLIEDNKEGNNKTDTKLNGLKNELEQLKIINNEYTSTIGKLNETAENQNQRIFNLKEQRKKIEDDIAKDNNKQKSIMMLELNEIDLQEKEKERESKGKNGDGNDNDNDSDDIQLSSDNSNDK